MKHWIGRFFGHNKYRITLGEELHSAEKKEDRANPAARSETLMSEPDRILDPSIIGVREKPLIPPEFLPLGSDRVVNDDHALPIQRQTSSNISLRDKDGPLSVSKFEAAIIDADADVRLNAVNYMVEVLGGSQAAIKALGVLRDSDSKVRDAAMQLLIEKADAGAIPPLIRIFAEDPIIAPNAVKVLVTLIIRCHSGIGDSDLRNIVYITQILLEEGVSVDEAGDFYHLQQLALQELDRKGIPYAPPPMGLDYEIRSYARLVFENAQKQANLKYWSEAIAILSEFMQSETRSFSRSLLATIKKMLASYLNASAVNALNEAIEKVTENPFIGEHPVIR